MLGCNRKKGFRTISLAIMIAIMVNLIANLNVAYVSATENGINYTLFSKNNIVINNYNSHIDGNVYAGKDFTYTGKEKAEITGTYNVNGKIDEEKINSEYENIKKSQEMIDFDDFIISKLKFKEEINEDVKYSNEVLNISSPLKIDGSLYLENTSLNGEGYVIVKNDIINEYVSDGKNEYNAFLYSKKGDILIEGTEVIINGILAAPKGKVKINAKKIVINGAVYADEIELNGSSLTINESKDLIEKLEFSPKAEINVTGELKENRKVVIDILKSQDIDYIKKNAKVTWEIKPVDTEDYEVKNEGIKIDTDASDDYSKEMIFKKAGKYLVTVKIDEEIQCKTIEKEITIEEDKNPIASVDLKSSYTRNPEKENKAEINIKDLSYSEDNDKIEVRNWQIYYDANNDGEYEEEVLSSEENKTSVVYKADKVGKYKIKLFIKENFTNTISKFINDEDYLTGEIEKEFTVDNVAPKANVEIEKEKKADIVFTIGNESTENIEKYNNKVKEIVSSLEEKGVKVNFKTVSTSSLTAKNSFEWKEYDHYNYGDSYLPTLAKHIIRNKKDIMMVGYSWAPLKDFLFIEDNNKGQKIFTFDLQRDKNNWHTMEGGGFLFNTTVTEDKIKGFCILVTSRGLRLAEIKETDLERFRNGSYENVYNAGTLLGEYPLDDVYALHSFKIVVDSKSISLWDGDKLIIDNYILPENDYGYGYGPIISHNSHGCSQQSYFTFSNIKMQAVQGDTLEDAINNYKWTEGAERYLINLSNSEVPDLKFNEDKYSFTKNLTEKDINLIGIGNEQNKDQFDEVIGNTKGLFLNLENEEKFETLKNYMTNGVLSKDYSIEKYIDVNEEIKYTNSYNDYENDEMYQSIWEYQYDPAIYENDLKDKSLQVMRKADPITLFENTGLYSLRLAVRDNPVGENNSYDDKRLWSDKNVYDKALFVQNNPKADMYYEVFKDKENEELCMVNITDNSYDIDHISAENKGIVERKYSWKKYGDEEWTEGYLPNKLTIGETYMLKMTVKDEEGMWSRPSLQIITTDHLIEKEEIVDEKAPEIYLELSKKNAVLGDTIKVNTYAKDENGISNFEVYVDGMMILQNPGIFEFKANKEGAVSVVVKAVDAYGNESEKEEKVVVLDNRDKENPIIDAQIATGEDITVYGSIDDNVEIKSYEVTYKLEGDNQYSLAASGNGSVENKEIAKLNIDKTKAGKYEIVIKAEDTSGNISYSKFMVEYTLKAPDVKPDTPDVETETPGVETETPDIETETPGVETETPDIEPEIPSVDTEKPLINIDLSSDRVKIGQEINATVLVTDNKELDTVEVYLDDTLILKSSGSLSFIANKTGVKTVKVMAKDKAGNTSISEKQCTIYDEADRIAPEIEVLSPSNGSIINGMLTIMGNVKDNVSLQKYTLEYRAEGQEQFNLFAESYNEKENQVLGILNTEALDDGLYEFRLTAEDRSGNKSSLTFGYVVSNKNVVFDIERPVINGHVSNYYPVIGEKVVVALDITDNIGVVKTEVLVDGVETPIQEDNTIFFTSNEEKISTVSITAYDAAGNMTNKIVQAYFSEPEIEDESIELQEALTAYYESARELIISFGMIGITPEDLIEMCENKKNALEEVSNEEEQSKEISLNNDMKEKNSVASKISTKAIEFNSVKLGWSPREEVEDKIRDAIPPETLAHIQAVANKKYKSDLENYTLYLYMSHSIDDPFGYVNYEDKTQKPNICGDPYYADRITELDIEAYEEFLNVKTFIQVVKDVKEGVGFVKGLAKDFKDIKEIWDARDGIEGLKKAVDKLDEILRKHSNDPDYDESKEEELIRYFVRAIKLGKDFFDADSFFKAIPIAKAEIELLYGVDTDEAIDTFVNLYKQIDSILQVAINGNVIGILTTTLDISLNFASMGAFAGLQYGFHMRVAARQKFEDEFELGNGSINLNNSDNTAYPGFSFNGSHIGPNNNAYGIERSSNGGTRWTPIPSDNEKTRVLNVYPQSLIQNTWLSSALQEDSSSMKADNTGYEKIGKELFEVDEISINDFNLNPESYLRDEEGNYKYDVIMFGSYENIRMDDISTLALKSVQGFAASKRGVLFGNNTVCTTPTFSNANFVTFAKNLGVELKNQDLSSNSTKGEILDKDYITSYPWSLSQKLDISTRKLLGQYAGGALDSNVWIKISDGQNRKTNSENSSSNDFYLVTNKNLGLINTTDKLDTEDEKKILVNALYGLNLNISKTSFVDKAFVDNASPIINNVDITLNEQKTSFSASISGEDKGTAYKYYVSKAPSDENDVERMSNIVSKEAKSGIKGYVIEVNKNPNPMPELIEYEKDKITVKNVVDLNNNNKEAIYNYAQTLEEGKQYYAHIYAVDNQNNVSEEFIKEIK